MGLVLYFYGRDLGTVDFTTPALLPSLAASLAIYVTVILIGAVAWRILLQAFGSAPPRWGAERQLLIAQIGKYVPGSVAQYLGRAALAMTSGVPARIVAIALVTEASAMIVGGLLSIAIAVAFAPELAGMLQQAWPSQTRVIWISSAAFVVILLVGGSLVSFQFNGFRKLPRAALGGLLLAGVLYTIAFLFLGVSLHLIVSLLSANPVPLTLSVAVFAAGWIAGLATPGAPGGLGVRETILTAGLAPLVGGPAALSAALLHRGVSVLGDVISFGLGSLLPQTIKVSS